MSGESYTTIVIGAAVITQVDRPAPPAQIVPVVTRRQALRALHEAELLPPVEAAIDALSEPARSQARIDWDNATEFRRDHPLVLQLGAALGLTPTQLDELFSTAATF